MSVPRVLAAGAALLAVALTAAPAGAKPVKPALTYTPAAPKSGDAVVVTFTAARLARGERYVVGVGGMSGDDQCNPGYGVKLPAQRPGRVVRVRLTPSGRNASGRVLPGTLDSQFHPNFCSGKGGVTLDAFDPDTKYRSIARRPITIAPGLDYPSAKNTDTPVRITLLDGSSLTARSAGRPDRTLGLAGDLGGLLPGKIALNTDITVPSLGGSVAFRNLAPDPVCAGSRYLTVLGTAAPSSLVLKQSGEATLTLVLAHPPTVLAGCADVSAVPATTTITLTGKVTPDGLTKLPVTGTVPGVQLGPGVTADLTMNLLVNVDLSGQPPA